MIQIIKTTYTCPNPLGGSAKPGEIVPVSLLLRGTLLDKGKTFNCYYASDSKPMPIYWTVFPGSFKLDLLTDVKVLEFKMVMPKDSVSTRIVISESDNPANAANSGDIIVLSDRSTTNVDEIVKTVYTLSVNTSTGGRVLVWANGQLQSGAAKYLSPIKLVLQAGTQVELSSDPEIAFSFNGYLINSESVSSGRTSFVMTENKTVMTSFKFNPVESVHTGDDPYTPIDESLDEEKKKKEEKEYTLIILAVVIAVAAGIYFYYRR